jgi:hypothetical protein
MRVLRPVQHVPRSWLRAAPVPGPAISRSAVVALLLLVSALLLSAPSLEGQDAASHLAGWYAWEGTWTEAGPGLGLELDVQLRDFQFADDFAQFSLRGGLRVAPASLPVAVTVGGAWFASGSVGPDDTLVTERRAYQTVSYTHHLSPTLRLAHRGRAEQRWFEADGFRTRYRYRLGVEVPLSGGEFGSDEPTLLVSDEVLVNGETRLDGGRRVARLDQNRSYIAVTLPLAEGARIEVGYLNINGGFAPVHRLRFTLKNRF